ncbi:MAG: hypothetical protein K8T89_12125 [Planctomycetes bacterium]|nr:hypothetical protein [Planctomycetota bacterium]
MNETGSYFPDDLERDLDRMLGDHLDRQARGIDPAPLMDRIQKTMAAEDPPVPVVAPKRSYRWLRWSAGLATAACLVVAVLVFQKSDQPLRASPQALLQETQKTFHQPVYRCYLVEVQRETNLTDESNPFVAPQRRTVLWTRGDRFWMETTFPGMPGMPPRRNFWGRDEQGTIWMTTFASREGALITPAETPRWLSVYSDLCSMQPDRLIAEVLRDFDLRREEATEGSPIHIITADLKPGRWHPALKGAVLELDSETKVLRRVVLQRASGPRWGGGM